MTKVNNLDILRIILTRGTFNKTLARKEICYFLLFLKKNTCTSKHIQSKVSSHSEGIVT